MRTYLLFIYLSTLVFCFACNRAAKESSETPASQFWTAENSPEKVSRKIIDDLLSRKKYMMYEVRDVKAVHYAEVATAYGAAEISGYLGDTATIKKLVERYMGVIEDSIPNTANHVDANVYGVLPLELYKRTGNEIFYRQGMELANGQWNDTISGGLTSQTRLWIDDIWMVGSLQVQAYRVTNDPVYLNRAAREIDFYLEELQQPNGLFFHGQEAHFFWGRGNGWVASGLAELLTELPKDNPYYPAIVSGYKKMMDALLQYQSEDGMWRQLIDHKEAWEESSSTAMFGYSMSVGVKERVFYPKKSLNLPVKKRGLRSLNISTMKAS